MQVRSLRTDLENIFSYDLRTVQFYSNVAQYDTQLSVCYSRLFFENPLQNQLKNVGQANCSVPTPTLETLLHSVMVLFTAKLLNQGTLFEFDVSVNFLEHS